MLQGSSGSGGGLTVLLLQMLAIGAVFYFLILRPSGQARKKHAELLSNLKKGDEVMTSGGIFGTKVPSLKVARTKSYCPSMPHTPRQMRATSCSASTSAP